MAMNKKDNNVISLDDKLRDNYLALCLAILGRRENNEVYTVNEVIKIIGL